MLDDLSVNPWRSSRWKDMWRWVRILWAGTKLHLPINEPVLRKTWIKSNIVLWKATGVSKFLKMVHYSTRFIYLGCFRWPKFPSFSVEGSGRKYLVDQLWRHLNIIPARIFLISSYFSRTKFATFAWFSSNFLRCSEMRFFGVSVMGGSGSPYLS